MRGKLVLAGVTPVAEERISLDVPVLYREYQRHINGYMFAGKFAEGKTILDVACGPGTGSSYLSTKGAERVVGGDTSGEALSNAKRWNRGKRGVEFVLLDGENLPFADASFDMIVSLDTIEHIKDCERFLAESRRILKVGGRFICSTPNKKVNSPLFQRPVNPYHVREFYVQELCSLLNRYFADVEVYGQHLLDLKNRVKIQAVSVIAHVLSATLRGNRIWRFLYRVYRIISREPYLERFNEDFDNMADSNHKVVLLSNSLNPVPETIVMLARKAKE